MGEQIFADLPDSHQEAKLGSLAALPEVRAGGSIEGYYGVFQDEQRRCFFLENGKANRSEYILLGEKYGNDGDMIYVSFEELIVFSENTLAI